MYQNGLPAAQDAVAKEMSAIEVEVRKFNMGDNNRIERLGWERNQISAKIFSQHYSEVKKHATTRRE